MRPAALVALALLAYTGPSQALTDELRWTHPASHLAHTVHVYVDGEAAAVVGATPPDSDGIVHTPFAIPYGGDVTIRVGWEPGHPVPLSDESNVRLYGVLCSDWDDPEDGRVGGPDFARFTRAFVAGLVGGADFGAFSAWFRVDC